MDNWPKIRNACRKRVRNHCELNNVNIDDATQEAVCFVFDALQRYDDPQQRAGIGKTREEWTAISIYRAVGRVKNCQSYLYEPRQRPRWEREPDFSRAVVVPISDNPELRRINWFEVENGVPA